MSYDDEPSGTPPRLAALNRWLTGQDEIKIIRPKPNLSPQHDLYAPKPEPPPSRQQSIRDMLGSEYFEDTKPKPKVRKRKGRNYHIGELAVKLGRSPITIRMWAEPPAGLRTYLPPMHKFKNGRRYYTEPEFMIIMKWAKICKLYETMPDGKAKSIKPKTKDVLCNFYAHVSEEFDNLTR